MKRTLELVECHRMMHKYFDTVQHIVLRDCGISFPQINVLTELSHEKHISLQELADQLRHEKSTVSRTVESLRQAGYLTAVKTSADRRTLDLSLTCKGEQLVAFMQKEIELYYRYILSDMTEEDQLYVLSGIRLLKSSVNQNLERLQNKKLA